MVSLKPTMPLEKEKKVLSYFGTFQRFRDLNIRSGFKIFNQVQDHGGTRC